MRLVVLFLCLICCLSLLYTSSHALPSHQQLRVNSSEEKSLSPTDFHTQSSAAAPVVYRDVKAYGARGDGVTDDTQAIITALTDGRADSPADKYPNAKYSASTQKPAFVFFPRGTYRISQSLPVTYYTQVFCYKSSRTEMHFSFVLHVDGW